MCTTSAGVKQGCTLSPTLSNIFQNDLHDNFNSECDPAELDKLRINSLSWADDLVLISKSQKGLQSCLDQLENYCKKWGLQVNEEKTKCMILSQGHPGNQVFQYNNTILENVNNYKYLGLIISRNGNLNNMVQDRVIKTNRAAFVLQKALSVGQNVSVNLAMTLFEKQLSPILLYGCPLWGIPDRMNYIKVKSDILTDVTNIRNVVIDLLQHVGANFSKEDLILVRRNKMKNEVLIKVIDTECKQELIHKLESAPVSLLVEDFQPNNTITFERPYTSFAKFALGVSKYTSNTLVLGELGKFPIQLRAIRQSILYWYRLEHGTTNTLLNYAYKECKDNNHDWIRNIKEFMLKNGLEFLWENVHSLYRNHVKYRVKENLQSQHIRKYNEYVHRNNTDNYEKCQMIRTCKMGPYQQSEYLDKIESPSMRTIFTRLRIDSNNLNDCKFRSYRFKNQDTDKCTFCPGEIDSVEHLILHCRHPEILKARNMFYDTYSTYHNNFVRLPDNEKLYYILNVTHGASSATHVICSFIKRIYGTSRCIDGG